MVDKTSINHCSKGCFSSGSAFFCDLVLFYPCSIQHCDPLALERFAVCLLVCPCFVVSRFIKFTLVASKATMYVADADVTFCFASTRIVSLYMYTVPGQASTY